MSGIDISNHSMQPCLVVPETSSQALRLKPLQALQVLPLQALGLGPLQALQFLSLGSLQAFFCSSVWEVPA